MKYRPDEKWYRPHLKFIMLFIKWQEKCDEHFTTDCVYRGLVI